MSRRRSHDRRLRRAPEPARDGILRPTRTSEPESPCVRQPPRATRRVPDGRSGRARPPAAYIALVIWFLFAGIALLIAVTTVSAFAGLTSDLAQPGDLDKLPFQEESIVYDRTGQIELARFGQSRREVVAFEDIPPIVIDAQTAVEDKTFWENTGFDPLAIVSAGVRQPPRPQPRRLDDHPAARPPAPAR